MLAQKEDETAGLDYPRNSCPTCKTTFVISIIKCTHCTDKGHHMYNQTCAVTCSSCNAENRSSLPFNSQFDVEWIFHHTVPDNEKNKKGKSLYALGIEKFDKGENPPKWEEV